LTRLVGSQEPVTAGSVPADELLPVENADALFATLGQAPDMLAAQSTLQSARASMRTARSTFLPTLSATYGRNGSGFDSGYGFRDPFAYASSFRLNFSLPIFNQLQREQTAIRAAVAEDAAEANLRDTGLRLREELTAAVGLLSNAQQRVSVQEASVRAAEEDLSIQQQRYDLNAALLLDVMQSQSALNQARAGLISARRDWRVARARIEALLGRELGSE
jgi:outer membrane protein